MRYIVDSLWFDYDVREIYGIKWGYRGFYEDFPKHWMELNPDNVLGINHQGGTMLGSSRGGFDADKMVEALKQKGINQLYILGGDGTHRGILMLQKELRAKGLRISIAGVPKTIDNDIALIDNSFGFSTAVEEAVKFIDSANTEAEAAEYGVGIVKVMGRHSGFIACQATNSSRDVNICLVPEIRF